MKKLSEILNEIGDSSYKINPDKDYEKYPDISTGTFDSKKSTFGYFLKNYKNDNHTSVTFDNSTGNVDHITGTEKNHAHKVFSTMKTVIKNHLQKNPHITHLQFTSKNEEGGRTKLYHQFSKSIDPDYQHRNLLDSTEFTVKADKLK